MIVLNLSQLRTTNLLTQSIMPKTNMIVSIEFYGACYLGCHCLYIDHFKIKKIDGRKGESLDVKPMA